MSAGPRLRLISGDADQTKTELKVINIMSTLFVLCLSSATMADGGRRWFNPVIKGAEAAKQEGLKREV